MLVNIGPQHPATHGVLRLVVELDGETVVRCIPHLGYLHSGFEKLGEYRHYNQIIPLTDRTDYLSPMANNVGFALAAEKLMGIEITPRCTVLRVIACEMSRIISHMVWLGTTVHRPRRIHAVPVGLPGARADLRSPGDVDRRPLTTSLTRVGGLMADIPDNFVDKLRDFTRTFPKTLAKSIGCSRARGVGGPHAGLGTLTAAEPSIIRCPARCCARAVWRTTSARTSHISATRPTTSMSVVGEHGDVFDRYLVRLEENVTSRTGFSSRRSTGCRTARSTWTIPESFSPPKRAP